MPRDRLNELKQAINGNTTIDIEDDNNNENGAKDENNDLRKTFERAEVITQWIQSIENNTEDVRNLTKRLFDMNHNQKDVQSKLQSLFQNTTSIGHQISTKLKELEAEIGKIEPNTAEGRIKNIQYNTIKTRFQEAFICSNRELEHYHRAVKQNLQAQLRAKGGGEINDDEVTALIAEGGDIHQFTENILQETAEQKQLLADVEERHQQLLKIERLLKEVRDLFVEMSILVDSQQELVDRVEYQAQTATDYVGAVDLGKIRRSKKKYLKRKLWFILIVVIFVIILLIALFK